MILGRLGVRQKLSLLLAIPLTMVVLLAVPFLADRIDDARTAGATAGSAEVARAVGALVQDVQRERLLSMGYLATPEANRSAVVLASQTVRDRVLQLRADLGRRVTEPLSLALTGVGELSRLRPGILDRTVPPQQVYDAFGAAVGDVVNALALSAQQQSDVAGGRQLGALDGLLRADEASSSIGAAFVLTALDTAGPARVAEATTLRRLHAERFRSLAAPEQVALFRTVDLSRAARRVDEVLRDGPTAADGSSVIPAAVAALESQAGLARLVEDRLAQQINTEAAAAARKAMAAAITVAVVAVGLFALVVGLVVAVTRSIARPLRRLSLAASAVADLANAELLRVADHEDAERETPRLAAIDIRSHDEIGELATAFNRVQATAALLLERQLVSRRNVATMFASVGRRTQNLVGRQLGMIEELERDETDPDLLAGLYRIDHVSARLRRTAYSLMVVAGATDESYGAEPLPLATVVRSAMGEIEGFRAIRLGAIADVTVSPQLVADLVLLMAELLENATSFSPPDRCVDVQAGLGGDRCRITVVDHGIGMSADQLTEENRRLVERERLDVVPTSVLGLFVVGRLSRRHGLSVRLRPTAGGGITALVDIPNPLLLGLPAPPAPVRAPSTQRPAPPAVRARADVVLPVLPDLPDPGPAFPWFRHDREAGADVTAPLAAAAPPNGHAGPPQIGRSGLTRRVPGARMFEVGQAPPPEPVRARDPDAERAAVAEFQAGSVAGGGRDDLVRRVPGMALSPGLRGPETDHTWPTGLRLDPKFERDSLNAFLDGFAEGSAVPHRDLAPQKEGGR